MVNLGQCDSLMAETWAVIYSLQMAWRFGCKKINFEMDSLLLTSIIKDQVQQEHFIPLLHKIINLLYREWEVTVNNVFCEANRCADYLANMGFKMNMAVHGLM